MPPQDANQNTTINNSTPAVGEIPTIPTTAVAPGPAPVGSVGSMPTVAPSASASGMPTLGATAPVTNVSTSVPTNTPLAHNSPLSAALAAAQTMTAAPASPTPATPMSTSAIPSQPVAMPATPPAPMMASTPTPVAPATAPVSASAPTPTAPQVNPTPAPAATPVPNPAPSPTPAPATPAPSMPLIPSVAPTAPGAEPKPVQPITDPLPEETKKEKKPDVVMIVLSVVLVLLIIAAGVLWWMNANGKSLFGPKTTTVVIEATPTPVAAEVEASDESELTADTSQTVGTYDLCYVNPDDGSGMKKETEDFVSWVNGAFTDATDNTGEYQMLFQYYLDRAKGAPELCPSHQLYCHVNFAKRRDFVAQFAHYNQQRDYQAQGLLINFSTYVPAQALRDLILLDFNMKDLNFADQEFVDKSIAPNGWQYQPSNDSIMSYGELAEKDEDYAYEYVGAKWLDVTGELVLIGEGVAKNTCKEETNCVCEASKMYLYLKTGDTNNLYFSDIFIEPQVGQFAKSGVTFAN